MILKIYSIKCNSGQYLGVKSTFTLLSSNEYIAKGDLCIWKLSSIIIIFFHEFFAIIFSQNFETQSLINREKIV